MKKTSFFNQKGKNHRYIYIIIFSIILASLFGVIINNTVTATTPTGYQLLNNFDFELIGATNGSNSDFTWEKTSGDDFEIYGTATPGAEKYVILGSYNQAPWGTELDMGWFNATEKHMGYYMFEDGDNLGFFQEGDGYIYFEWKNDTDDTIVEFRTRRRYDYDTDDGGTTLQYNDGASWVTLYDNWATSGGSWRQETNLYFSWAYYVDNLICYTLYDSNWNVITEMIDTGLISGAQYQNSSQFNLSNCYIYITGTAEHWISEYGALTAESALGDIFIKFIDLETLKEISYLPINFEGPPTSNSLSPSALFINETYAILNRYMQETGFYSFNIDFDDGTNKIELFTYGSDFLEGYVNGQKYYFKTTYYMNIKNKGFYYLYLQRIGDAETDFLSEEDLEYYGTTLGYGDFL